MKTPLYRIEELSTSGWFVIERYEKMTKENAKTTWDDLVLEGYNPNRMRIVRDD